MRAGFGPYTTVWFSERKNGYRWWQGPRNGSRLNHFEANLNQAFEAADEYVWIFSEHGTWLDWPESVLRSSRPEVEPSKFKPLEELIPGFNSVVAAVKDPIAWGERRIAEMRENGTLVDLLKVGGAMRCDGNGYMTLRVGRACPGERYAFEVVVRPELTRSVFTTRFKKPESEKEQVLWTASRDSLSTEFHTLTRRSRSARDAYGSAASKCAKHAQASARRPFANRRRCSK